MTNLSTFLVALVVAAGIPSPARAETYVTAQTALRASPGRGKVVDVLDANQTVSVLETQAGMARVRVGTDGVGWLPAAVLSDTWIKVWKREPKVFLFKGDTLDREYRVALSCRAGLSRWVPS